MRLLVAAGASGGGVYPALAVLQELNDDSLELLWVGGEGGMEEDLVTRAGYQITTLPAAGLHGVGLAALPRNLLQLWRGYWAAHRLLRQFRPHVLFFTGGYVAAPVALAAGRIPTLAFVPDVKPGFALRLVARFADVIAIVTDASRKYFRNAERLRVTGYPLRRELAKWNPGVARAHFGLSNDTPTLLVFGGSKGAQSINRALLNSLLQLLPHMHVIHITGAQNWEEMQESAPQLPADLAARYLPFPYLHEDMGAALAAADLVLARAGASALGEFPAFNLPAILVPIPFEGHLQHLNAQYLEKRGAAVILKDADMPNLLADTVLALMKDAPRRAGMAEVMGCMANPRAAKQIAGLLRQMGAAEAKEAPHA